MKVLSLTQPWATLVAVDAKRYETRSWRTHYRGDVAIHASMGYPKACKVLEQQEPFRTVLQQQQHLALDQDLYGQFKLPLGVIVAVVELVDCVPSEEAVQVFSALPGTALRGVVPAQHDQSFGDYSPGRFIWVLRNLRRLTQPVPASGRRLLWDYPLTVDLYGNPGPR